MVGNHVRPGGVNDICKTNIYMCITLTESKMTDFDSRMKTFVNNVTI
ncbi:MAG: hypothetical protein K0S32_3958 [Bacteroidetes bacterium]|jgi:hypothetical protein|nr:hypothetical protein [Bacteroidota bacterium]